MSFQVKKIFKILWDLHVINFPAKVIYPNYQIFQILFFDDTPCYA
jgi:hypothetical protein